jgi:hypothetical protein
MKHLKLIDPMVDLSSRTPCIFRPRSLGQSTAPKDGTHILVVNRYNPTIPAATVIGDLLSTPFSVDQSIANKITSLGKTNLDPEWAQRKAAFDAEQANAGRRRFRFLLRFPLSGDASPSHFSRKSGNRPNRARE